VRQLARRRVCGKKPAWLSREFQFPNEGFEKPVLDDEIPPACPL